MVATRSAGYKERRWLLDGAQPLQPAEYNQRIENVEWTVFPTDTTCWENRETATGKHKDGLALQGSLLGPRKDHRSIDSEKSECHFGDGSGLQHLGLEQMPDTFARRIDSFEICSRRSELVCES